MDDLLGEDWQKPAPKPTPPPAQAYHSTTLASTYSSLRASPALPQSLPQSGASTPSTLSRPSSTVNGGSSSRPSTNDSFGNLVSLKPQKAGVAAQSMQERQKQLLDEKRRQEQQQSQLWENLGRRSGTATPEINRQASPAAVVKVDDEEDILAAFNKDAPVNRASYFSPPPPSGQVSGRSTPAVAVVPPVASTASASAGFDDDDDPFGLNEVSKKSNGHVARPAPKQVNDDDDDILGDLGKPVSEKPRQASRGSLEEPMIDPREEDSIPVGGHDGGAPQDRALAELVDMGFPADTARIALSENGGNVQGAVGWLLQQAHEASRQKAREDTSTSRSPQPRQTPSTDREGMPAWLRQEESGSGSRRQDARSPANGELDPAQRAQELGTKFFKSANALWKASQKQMAKTIAEFQQEGDPNQPRWMRDPAVDSAPPEPQRRQPPQSRPPPRAVDVTDEAAMLDAPRQRPSKPSRPTAPPQMSDALPSPRPPVEPLPHRQAAQPKFMQQAPSLSDKKPTSKLSRQDVEDQSAQAYVSPARRKKAPPKPEPQPEPEVDLFSPAPVPAATAAPSTQPRRTSASRSAAPPQAKPQTPMAKPTQAPAPAKPQVPARTIPAISPTALATSANHRKQGGEHFKRGDYASAHASYTSALTPLPPTHPIAIVVLTNHALTALKTGEPKVAVTDADRALEIIGPGGGVGEMIDLGNGEGSKAMREFYGKAVMRKAEALESMEKYSEAAQIWRTAVAAGVGGAVSLKGRDRCEKAAGGGTTAANGAGSSATGAAPKVVRNTTPGPGKAPPPRSLGNSLNRPTIPSASSATAVKALRAANAEAEKIDDEKFALADSVDARLTAWRNGKTDNLRALLQSLDSVLWEGAGWKKVGMSDLVIAGKVKVVYMKAIAKVHPDKIPQDATTEQRMISAAVFATLNEAWDKFKKDNNL